MFTFTVKGHDFSLPERFQAGHYPSSGESTALNRYITGSLKAEILAGNIKTRQEAWEYVMGDKCLALRDTRKQTEVQELELLEGL